MNIFGASGHAKVIIESLKSMNCEILNVFDDDENIHSILDYKVKKLRHRSMVSKDDKFIIAIGDNLTREKVVNSLDSLFVNAIHISALISESSSIGVGNAIMANTVINAGTVIGDHCIINTSASVDHDCQIDNFVHIAPNSTLCGGVKIGRRSLIGAGSVITPNVVIGEDVIIGAGAVITKDIDSRCKVLGVNKVISKNA